ncbi:MAG: DnaJ domain-containing protein [Polyangiaceae bacterium]
MDGFVLSQVDGHVSERELGEMTGLVEPVIKAILDKLERLGLVVFDEPTTSGTSGRYVVTARRSRPPPAEIGGAATKERKSHPPPVESARPMPTGPVPTKSTRLSVPPESRRPTPESKRPPESRRPSDVRRASDSGGPPDSKRPPESKRGRDRTTTPPPSERARVRKSSRPPSSARPSPAAAPSPPPAPATPASPASGAALDLPEALQKRIDDTFASLPNLDHYALLGVQRTDDKKTIKRAYYDLAAIYHPDRYFRKNLGPYKHKMETIFGKMTAAHDALSSKIKRAEYDAYLGVTAKTHDVEARLDDVDEQVRRIEAEIAEAARRAAAKASVPPAPDSQFAPEPTTTSGSRVIDSKILRAPPVPKIGNERPSTPPPAPGTPTKPSDSSARDALARRLLGGRGAASKPISIVPPKSPAPPKSPSPPAGSPVPPKSPVPIRTATRPPPTPSSPTPPTPTASSPASPKVPSSPAAAKPAPGAGPVRTMSSANAMDSLRRRYEEQMGSARGSQLQRLTASAAESLAKGDAVGAANAYRVALTLAPDDETIKKAFAEAERAADLALADTYLRKAQYEEKNEEWAGAAASWSKVAKARPEDANANERAAHALTRSRGNLQQAAVFGKQAVTVEPKNPKYRRTLAEVYVAAGMHQSAKRELEMAAQLAPDDVTIKDLLKQVQKGL